MVILNTIKNEYLFPVVYANQHEGCCIINRNLTKFLYAFCEECAEMASIPHGAFAACKLRSNNKKGPLVISTVQSVERKEMKKFISRKVMEYTPVKYNSKLMNSIWGIYNRYSPHNIKNNDEELVGGTVFLQESVAVAGYLIAEGLHSSMESGKEWKF